jgi:hypothetical protein
MDILLEGVDFKELPIRRAMVLDTMGYYLPIPERDILYNPNLEQNPFDKGIWVISNSKDRIFNIL